MKKIRTDRAALRFIQFGMRLERLFHVCRTRLEDIEQSPVTTFEILDHVAQLLRGSCCIELKNSADNMVGPSLIGWVDVSGFSRAGLKGLTTTLAGSGRRYKIWRFMNRDCDKEAPWGCSRCDRANGAGYQFRLGFHSAYRSSALEPAYFHKTEKIR